MTKPHHRIPFAKCARGEETNWKKFLRNSIWHTTNLKLYFCACPSMEMWAFYSAGETGGNSILTKWILNQSILPGDANNMMSFHITNGGEGAGWYFFFFFGPIFSGQMPQVSTLACLCGAPILGRWGSSLIIKPYEIILLKPIIFEDGRICWQLDLFFWRVRKCLLSFMFTFQLYLKK